MMHGLSSRTDAQKIFVRGGPNLITFFFVDDGVESKYMYRYKWVIIGPPAKSNLKRRFAGGPMIAQH